MTNMNPNRFVDLTGFGASATAAETFFSVPRLDSIQQKGSPGPDSHDLFTISPGCIHGGERDLAVLSKNRPQFHRYL
jgi:hypothetical protein